ACTANNAHPHVDPRCLEGQIKDEGLPGLRELWNSFSRNAGPGHTLSAVQFKETLLDEMEPGFWSASSQRRPLQPELRLRTSGTHVAPERLRPRHLLPVLVPAVLWLRTSL